MIDNVVKDVGPPHNAQEAGASVHEPPLVKTQEPDHPTVLLASSKP